MNANIATFNQHGGDFWNKNGAYRTLHEINPARLQFIERHISLKNQKILDVGCGGGILSESLALKGARVSGIDLSPSVLESARNHLQISGLNIDYRQVSTRECVANQEQYDHIMCLEMLEHCDHPFMVISDLFQLVKPNGRVFFSTLNRNIKSYLGAIVFAEKIFKWLPNGTHDYHHFIRPEELVAMSEKAGFRPVALSGLDYHPLLKSASLSRNLSINYLYVAEKPSTF